MISWIIMYDNYNERGLGRMTLGAGFGIGSLAALLFDHPNNTESLIIMVFLSLIVFIHGYLAHIAYFDKKTLD